MERRTLLKAAGAAVACAAPLAFLFAQRTREEGKLLVPDPAGLLDLPPGYSYQVIGRSFERMSDGLRAPAEPDGMGCFALSDGSWVLMRNHELARDASQGAFGGRGPSQAFDPEAQGGVTRLVLDPRSLAVRSSNLALAGTLRNCSGGPSPWGWLTCEEAVDEGHGYVFACPADSNTLAMAHPIRGYGRFRHEAVAVDPRTNIAYLTEDQNDGCLYRFVPTKKDVPFVGRLQALSVVDAPSYDSSERLATDRAVRVRWVDVADPDPSEDVVRQQAHELGAARVRRGEGIAYHDGELFFTATTGGRAGRGQILRLRLGALATEEKVGESTDTLELLAEANDETPLDCPDNVTVAPWGEVFVAEDGSGDQFIRAISPDGRVRDIARNAMSSRELAGVCFSPDGSTLFFNMQGDGLTVAVRGPFREQA